MRASVVLIVSLALGLSAVASANGNSQDAPRSQPPTPDRTVVAQVGSATITAADLERRIRSLGPSRLRRYGTSPEGMKRGVLEKALIPEALYAEESKVRTQDGYGSVRDSIVNALGKALKENIRREVMKPGTITDAEVSEFYHANIQRFQAPERIQIWRILVKTHEAALQVISAAGDKPSVRHWQKLAERHSMDPATRHRRGDLGFVHPSGQTARPQVSVDKALFAAASRAQNGALLKEPVREGDGFAVVWRRGAVPAVHRPLHQERHHIRKIITRQKWSERLRGLLETLRSQHASEPRAELLEYVQISVPPAP